MAGTPWPPLLTLPPSFPPLPPPDPSRIYEILPQRIQQWQQSPCVAEEHGKRLLERIRREQHQARLRLQEMERRFHELEGLIARAKGHPPREDEEVTPPDPRRPRPAPRPTPSSLPSGFPRSYGCLPGPIGAPGTYRCPQIL